MKELNRFRQYLRENQYNFPSEDEIKEKSEMGGWVTLSKNGINYDINYTVSSESDDEMSFGVYPSGGSEDEEQIAEFYTYDELVDWFKGNGENIEEGFFGDLKQNIAMKIAQMSFNSASTADKVRTLFSILNDFEKKHPEIKNNPDFDALKKDIITSRITSVLEFVERVKALKGGE